MNTLLIVISSWMSIGYVVQIIQTTVAMLLKLARHKIRIGDHYSHVGR